MFAVVNLGDKQFKVQLGDFVRSPFLKESESQKEISLPVLAYGDDKTFLHKDSDCKKIKVKARVLRQGRTKKVIVFKKKRRKDYRRTRGHRQKFTELQIVSIGSQVFKPQSSAKSSVSKSQSKPSSPAKSSVSKSQNKSSSPTKKVKA